MRRTRSIGKVSYVLSLEPFAMMTKCMNELDILRCENGVSHGSGKSYFSFLN